MKLFYNGSIITMNNNIEYDSILIDNDTIKWIGNYKDFNYPLDDIEIIDLKNTTMLPSFIDSHSHITSMAMSNLECDLYESESITEIINRLNYYISKNNIENNDFIIGSGYEHNNLLEKRHPNKLELDKYFKDYPIVIKHKSNHFAVFNSKALELLNIKSENGLLCEDELQEALKKIPMPSLNKMLSCYKQAQEIYASYGITIVQEGMIVDEMLPIYLGLLSKDILYLDVFGYVDCKSPDLIDKLNNKNDHFKAVGYKAILDGSPQGNTAWISGEYKTGNSLNKGLVSDLELYNYFKLSIDNNRQLLMHANGDMAIDQIIRVAKMFSQDDVKKIKPVIIHAQLLNKNQLEDIHDYGLIPSYFSNHIYHYSDIHLKNIGDRALDISPIKSTISKDVLFTLHQDSPVVKPNMLESIYSVVVRKGKNNTLLNQDECVSVYEALKGVTINPAIMYSIDDEYGTLEVGKKASFVIMDKNILKVCKCDILNINILKTYKDGKLIFNKE